MRDNKDNAGEEYEEIFEESTEKLEKKISSVVSKYLEDCKELSNRLGKETRKIEETKGLLEAANETLGTRIDGFEKVAKKSNKISLTSSIIIFIILLIASYIMNDIVTDMKAFREDINQATDENTILVDKIDSLASEVDSLSEVIAEQDLSVLRGNISELSMGLDSLQDSLLSQIGNSRDSILIAVKNNLDSISSLDSSIIRLDTLVNSSIVSNQGILLGLEENIVTLEDSVGSNSSRLNSLYTKVQSAISEMVNDLDSLPGHLTIEEEFADTLSPPSNPGSQVDGGI